MNVNGALHRVSGSVFSFSARWHRSLGKAHTRSAPSLSSLPKVALETVPMFVRLNTDRARPRRLECRPLAFSTLLSFSRFCFDSNLFMGKRYSFELTTRRVLLLYKYKCNVAIPADASHCQNAFTGVFVLLFVYNFFSLLR